MSNNLIEFDLGFVDAVVIGGGADDDGSYDEGYEVGKAEGLEEGKSIGYADGYSKGEEAGFESGKDEGFKSGYSDGFVSGESHGYEKGYADGSKGDVDTVDLNLHLTSNGTFIYEKPEDKYYGEISVKVDVEERLPEQEKEITITENGEATVTPDDGFALNLVRVITNVPEPLPEQEKTLDIIENGSYEVVPDDGFALSKVTVNANVGGSEEVVKIKTYTLGEIDLSADSESNFAYLFKSMDWTYYNRLKKTNFNNFFNNYQGKTLDISNLDTSNATKMNYMFSKSRVESLDLSNFDTSNVTTMRQMFQGCSLKSLDLSNFDTSKVTDMYGMFDSCQSLKTLDLSNFDTSKVTNISSFLYQCGWLTSVTFGDKWDTSNVTNMDSFCSSCGNLVSIDLSKFDTSKVTYMGQEFLNDNKLTTVTFANNWASNANVTNLRYYSSPFSKETMLDLANKIADKSDTSKYTRTYSVQFKSAQKALFTEDELTALSNQFTAKNWTLTWY